jgi:hypothetical protein
MRPNAELAPAGFVINASQGMFDIVIAPAPGSGPLPLAELCAPLGLVAGSYVLSGDGSVRAWNFAGEKLTTEEFEAAQRALVKGHASRHPQGPVARAFAEHNARSRALRLWLPLAPRRATTSPRASTRRAPRAVRRVRRATSALARSPDEPPTGEGGDAPRRGDPRWRGAL